LFAKTQALRNSTVDAEGWPHAPLLSAGDMLAMLPDAFASLPSPSRRHCQFMHDGRVTVTLS
jgi:hypothetical protein